MKPEFVNREVNKKDISLAIALYTVDNKLQAFSPEYVWEKVMEDDFESKFVYVEKAKKLNDLISKYNRE